MRELEAIVMNQAETEERAYLREVQQTLDAALAEIDIRVRRYAEDVQTQKNYLWEHKADMDHVEKISTRESIQQSMMTGETVLAGKQRLLKLKQSPYFGRFDFRRDEDNPPEAIYVGVHHFYAEKQKKNLIYDWRAPIASIFYDYETGPATYQAPSGEVSGNITLKRQFRIRDGEMEFMLESSLNILDDVLQEELSRTSDDRMRNIVATIQRDQNVIIRNEHAHELIIQGVAGSGKTSIALHRIAFLLYRFKDTLTSRDILIISPNRVFADYISNVLPELGEEKVTETDMESLAHELLDYKYKFQSFFEQAELLLEGKDVWLQERIREKSSINFLKKLDEYVNYVESSQYVTQDLWIARRLVPGWLIKETFRKHSGYSPAEQLSRVVNSIEQNIGIQYHYDLSPEDRKTLRSSLKEMVKKRPLRKLYQELFVWLGRPEMFKLAKGGKLEYADVFPLIYLKMRLEGVSKAYRQVKHLLIDEMQDYTPVQYAVIARLFPCNKTILGDANQSVNPFCTSNAETIAGVLHQAECVKLYKSYRSTYEVSQFAQSILPNPDLVAIERHGEAPRIEGFRQQQDEIEYIKEAIRQFRASSHQTLGIICKTQKLAERLMHQLATSGEELHLLDARSTAFKQGVVICSAQLAKGLEFDQVFVPHVDAKNYATEFDRSLLYIACTRAMHKLTLTYSGTGSTLLMR
jgi:DNA helicase-2/ATP-dependent DNA helicase PcrA